MADKIPIKIVDIGSGQGQLREFASSDTIPEAHIPHTFTSPLSVPAGASGAQIPQAQEIGTLANAQLTTHYKRSNILGTVSQSGGVPTGAIIEQGSNANGYYVKYADGTLICTRLSDRFTTSASEGSVFASPVAGTYAWAHAFSSSPYVQISSITNLNANCWVANAEYSTTSISTFRFYSNSSAGSAVASIFAIGRWF